MFKVSPLKHFLELLSTAYLIGMYVYSLPLKVHYGTFNYGILMGVYVYSLAFKSTFVILYCFPIQGGESRGLNDRVHGISCRYSDKTCKKINYISTNTYSIIMK